MSCIRTASACFKQPSILALRRCRSSGLPAMTPAAARVGDQEVCKAAMCITLVN